MTIRDLRREKNLTQGQLAEKAGISRSTVVALEKGTTQPESSTEHRIAHALGVDHSIILFPSTADMPKSEPKQNGQVIESLKEQIELLQSENAYLRTTNSRLLDQLEKLTSGALAKPEDVAQPGAYGLPLFAIEAGNMRGQHPGGASA